MKLTSLILITVILHVSASSLAQKVTLSAKKQPLSKVFEQISNQTGYDFAYTTRTLKNANPVNIEVVNKELPEVLKMIFSGQPLEYSVEDKTVIINEKEKSFIDNLKAQITPVQPSTIIDLIVIDERGKPLPGVSIRVKNRNFTFTTNEKGEFKFANGIQDAVLQFTFIGYISREIPVSQLKSGAAIVLKEDIGKLDEVQVVAYGTTTKRLSTGDQTSISAADIAKYPTSNVLDVLQGSVPGLVISKNTGNPGSSYKVQLRGTNGVNGRPPLYIVDGIPLESGGYRLQNGTLGSQGIPNASGQSGDALSFINPLDIESVTVLKDASATAIYGTRAADGVIIITTKKGKQGNMRADVSFSSGYTELNHFPSMLNLQQYLQMRKEAKRNDNSAIGVADYDINGVWDTTRTTDWGKALLGAKGYLTNAQVAISGGNNNTQYRVSTGYNRQTNLAALGGSNQTGNLGFSINSKSDNDKFSVQLSGGYTYNLNTISQADLTGNLILAPDAPALYNPDGTLNFQNNTFNNPLVNRNLLNNTTGTGITSSASVSYRPVSNLEFKAALGYNRQQMNEFLGTPKTAFIPTSNDVASSSFANSNNSWWSIEPQVNYNKDISKGKLSVIIGSSLQKRIVESTQLKASGFSSDLLLRSISAGTTITSIVPYTYEPYKLNSIFGRVSYNWDNKYVLDISGRDDGSSHFGENRQFHLFSAVGAAWIFSEENLIKNNVGFLSYGKLRASYGVTGRDNITPYQYLDTYGLNNAQAYQGVAGLLPSALPNANLSWESTTKSEISTELQFLKSRIVFETNFYHNRTSNVLLSNPLSLVTGFSGILQNLPAIVQNQGFDISLRGNNINTANFTWSTTLLFTRDRNKLISYPGLDKSGFASQYIIGQPVGILHVYSFAGVNPQTGIYQFYSKSGAIVSSPIAGTDQFKTVDTNPDFFGSVQNSFRYKQFTLDFLLRFIKQVGLNAFGQQTSIPPGISPNINSNTLVLNRWQKPGDITDIQRYGTNFSLVLSQSNAIKSDHAYGDASYIRFQNLSFAYAFPKSALNRLHLQNLQVYIQGENLLTISKYGAIDPENQSSIILPPLRTLTTGLRLTF